jgi:hypothetical protein
MILTNIISSFDISIPHPTSLKSPLDPKFRVTGLAEKVFNFSRDSAAAKLINDTPTILLNHQIFDVNREKQGKITVLSFSKVIVHRKRIKKRIICYISNDLLTCSIIDDTDVIGESTGILFIAIVLAHEITNAINLSRSINNAMVIEKNTPNLMLFRSYSHGGNIDGGNLVERLLLEGELHLSKPPLNPPMLFLIVSADGTQVPLSKEVVEECIKNYSFMTISQLINSWQNTNARQLMNGDCKKGLAGKLPALEPLLNFQILTFDIDPPSSFAIRMLTSMMHAQYSCFFIGFFSLLFVFLRILLSKSYQQIRVFPAEIPP